MIGLLQRVRSARVEISGAVVGRVDTGLLVMVAVERGDSEASAERLLERLLGYRVFPDDQGKMNRSVQDIGGGILFVPQFTLAADTANGTRPSFTPAAPPEQGKALYGYLVESARKRHAGVASGVFGADMQVTLTNNGPVTFWLQAN